MKIGIISDSHDNVEKLKKAVEIFNTNNIDFVLHAGDYVAPFSVKELNALKCPFLGVFGNNDGEKKGLKEISKGKIKSPFRSLKLKNRKIVIAHEFKLISRFKGKADLAVFGHTHKAQVYKDNTTLFVNPGECGGWLYGKSTIAIVDLEDLSCHILEI